MSYRHGLANAIRVLPLVALPLCFVPANAQAGKAEPDKARVPAVERLTTRQQRRLIRHNEAGAIMSLRTLFSSEATYQATTGNGDYGTLAELRKAGLIDQVLGEGHRYGYLFRIRREKISLESPQSSLEITAVPRAYGRTGRRSFYLDETGVIHALDKNGAEATHADHVLVIDP